jgi:hypothetical protein
MAEHVHTVEADEGHRTIDLPAIAEDIGDRAVGLAEEIGAVIKERPMTSLAVAAGLAFAVGALWKMGRGPQSRFDQLMASMPDVQSRAQELARRWF